MPLSLYFSALESPRAALVFSQLNPLPVRMRDLAHEDNVAAEIYLVDGLGDYDDRSGNSSYTLKTSLGVPGSTPIWLNDTWTPINNGWTGAIQTTASGFADRFTATGMNPIELTLEAKLFNPQGAANIVAQIPVLVYKDQLPTTANQDVLVNAILGSFRLTQGQDAYTITGLGLVSMPLALLLHPIRKPASGLNIFATPVKDTLSADGFSFTLSGQPDSADYWLDYVITFGNTSGVGAPPSFINYAGPPLVNPPLLSNIVVDVNYRQWQYGSEGWK